MIQVYLFFFIFHFIHILLLDPYSRLLKSRQWITPGCLLQHRTGGAQVTVDNYTYYFGGKLTAGSITNEVVRINATTLSVEVMDTRGEIPPGRVYHTAVEYDKKMIVFGGVTEQKKTHLPIFYDDVYELDLCNMEWTRLEPADLLLQEATTSQVPDLPPGLCLHSAAVWETKMYVFGGLTQNGEVSNVLYSFDLETHRWVNESAILDSKSSRKKPVLPPPLFSLVPRISCIHSHTHS